MLKKIYTKKLIVCSIVIFAILLIYFIPGENEKLKYSEEVEYVNIDVKTSKIFLLDSNNYLASTDIITKSNDIKDKAKELIEALIIDGKKLAELMIEYNLGVSLEIKYEVKSIDNDFFEEEA